MNTSDSLAIKVSMGETIRRFSLKRTQATQIRHLQEAIVHLFELQTVPKLRYEDSDSDLVTLSSDEDIMEAIACCSNNVLRLQVSMTDTPWKESNEFVVVEPDAETEQNTHVSVQSVAAELCLDEADLNVSMISDISAAHPHDGVAEKDDSYAMSASTDLKDAVTVLERFAAAVVFTGYGSKSQFADIDSVIDALLPQLKQFDDSFGHGKWLALFGGDPFTDGKPDVAHVMKFVQSQGTPVMAVQADKVLHEWGGCDKWLDFVHYYPTDYSSDGQVLWSGFHPDSGELAGSSRIWFGHAFLPHVKAYVAVGGGPIACDEVRHAQSVELPVHYIRCEAARYPEINGLYGPVDELFASAASKASKNDNSLPSPSSSDSVFGGLLKKFGNMFSPPCLVVDDEDPAHMVQTSEAEQSPDAHKTGAMGKTIASMGFFDETDLTASMAAEISDALQHIDDEVQQELHADEGTADDAAAEEVATDKVGEAEAETNGGDFTANEAETMFPVQWLDAVAAMTSMGFEHSSASAAIARTKGDIEAAITLLLSTDRRVTWDPEWDTVCAELNDVGFSSTEQEIKSVVGEVKGSYKLAVKELLQRERNA